MLELYGWFCGVAFRRDVAVVELRLLVRCGLRHCGASCTVRQVAAVGDHVGFCGEISASAQGKKSASRSLPFANVDNDTRPFLK